MSNKHIFAVTALFLLAAPLQACLSENPDTDESDGEEDVAEAQQALSYKTFYISNPTGTGKSYKLKVTASIPSGTGKIYEVDIFNINSPYAMIDVSCGGAVSCSATRNLYGCTNYGTVPVTVEYSGAVVPKLTYWFYDC